MQLAERTFVYFDSDFTDICLSGSNLLLIIIGSEPLSRGGENPLPLPIMTQIAGDYIQYIQA